MKRYKDINYDFPLIEHPDGEWAKADIAIELYNVLNEIPIGLIPSKYRLQVRNVLQKARGEGE